MHAGHEQRPTLRKGAWTVCGELGMKQGAALSSQALQRSPLNGIVSATVTVPATATAPAAVTASYTAFRQSKVLVRVVQLDIARG